MRPDFEAKHSVCLLRCANLCSTVRQLLAQVSFSLSLSATTRLCSCNNDTARHTETFKSARRSCYARARNVCGVCVLYDMFVCTSAAYKSLRPVLPGSASMQCQCQCPGTTLGKCTFFILYTLAPRCKRYVHTKPASEYTSYMSAHNTCASNRASGVRKIALEFTRTHRARFTKAGGSSGVGHPCWAENIRCAMQERKRRMYTTHPYT